MIQKTKQPTPENIEDIRKIHTAFKVLCSKNIKTTEYKCNCEQKFKNKKTYKNHKKYNCQINNKSK